MQLSEFFYFINLFGFKEEIIFVSKCYINVKLIKEKEGLII